MTGPKTKTGNYIHKAVESEYANAITACLTLSRDISLDVLVWPVMDKDSRTDLLKRVSQLHDEMEAAVLKHTQHRYQLPEIYR